MNMICPHCSLKGAAEDRLLGKKVRCPECQKVFRVTEEIVNKQQAAEYGEQLGVVEKTQQQILQSPAVELPDGTRQCEKCGFALSEKYFKEIDSQLMCAVCAA